MMIRQRQFAVLCGDITVFIVSFCIMALIRFDVSAQGDRIWFQIGLFSALFVIWLLVFFIFELYNIRNINPNPRTIGLLITAMMINMILAMITFYLVPQSGISPKTNLLIFGISACILLVVWRRTFYALFTSRFARSIGIVGTNPLIIHLKHTLELHPHIGVVEHHWDTLDLLELPTAAVNILITESVPPQTVVLFSQKLQAEVLTLSTAYETLFGKIPVELMHDEKAVAIIARQSNRTITVITRVMEVTIALLILIISSPILLITALSIRIDSPGPILLKQLRIGRNGIPFTLYKFRSMIALNPDGSAESDGAAWAQIQDNRITRIGRIIRTLHLDEIPQMINIVKGDLALVGPRPERPELVTLLEQEIPYYFIRHTIRPGFTGWAQIKFRYARTILDSREKFEYDLYYLTHKSPLLDTGIFLKTVQIIFTH